MALFLVKFPVPATPDDPPLADVLLDAADGDAALAALERNGVTETPARLVEIPPGLFCAEVRWADEDAGDVDEEEDDAGDVNPANFAPEGVAFVPFDGIADFLELEANAAGVIDAAAPSGGGS